MLFTEVTTVSCTPTPVAGGRRLAQHPDRAKRQTSGSADAGYPRSMALCGATECIAKIQQRIWYPSNQKIWYPSNTLLDDPITLTTWKLNHASHHSTFGFCHNSC
jgi:hypothetical protein